MGNDLSPGFVRGNRGAGPANSHPHRRLCQASGQPLFPNPGANAVGGPPTGLQPGVNGGGRALTALGTPGDGLGGAWAGWTARPGARQGVPYARLARCVRCNFHLPPPLLREGKRSLHVRRPPRPAAPGAWVELYNFSRQQRKKGFSKFL